MIVCTCRDNSIFASAALVESPAAVYHGWQVEVAAAMATRDTLAAALVGKSVRATLPGAHCSRLT